MPISWHRIALRTFVLAELGRKLHGAVQALAVVLEEHGGDPLRHVTVLARGREERLAERQDGLIDAGGGARLGLGDLDRLPSAVTLAAALGLATFASLPCSVGDVSKGV